LVVILFLSVFLSLPAVYLYGVRVQESAVAKIIEEGGQVLFDYEFDGNLRRNIAERPAPPSWLPISVDERYLRTAVYVNLSGKHITDENLEPIRALRWLRFVVLRGASVTDDGVAILADLKQLEQLDLEGTQVTDRGLKHLYSLIKLELVKLDGTGVTSAGIEELKRNLLGCRVDTGGPIIPMPETRVRQISGSNSAL
jgi:hypothetical protein